MKARFGLVLWLLTMAALGSWLAVMSLDNEPPYVWDASETSITPNPAKGGEMVTVNWKMTINRICPGSSSRSLIDADTGMVIATYDATPVSAVIRTGDKSLIRTFQLPRGLPPRVGYKSTICFRCNVLQALMPLCVSTPTIKFRVED